MGRNWILCALTLVCAQPVVASCGLHGCPLEVATPNITDSAFRLQAAIQQTAFDVEGISGDYTQITPRIEYTGVRNLIFGGYLPLVSLRKDTGGADFGIGNAVVLAEYAAPPLDNFSVAFGLQYEIPIGDHEAGMADDHQELLPYISLFRAGRIFGAFARLGFRKALGSEKHAVNDEPSDHEHEHGGEEGTVLVVGPHAGEEIVYRFGITTHLDNLNLTPVLYVDGQHVVEAGIGVRDFAAVGLAVSVPIGPRYQLSPRVEVSFTDEVRFKRGASVAISASF